MKSIPAINQPRIILPDVSLAAIVRDEMMNPSGPFPNPNHGKPTIPAGRSSGEE